MLYRTSHHPFLYTINAFSHSYSLSPLLLSSSPPPPQPQKMECLKNEICSETARDVDDVFVDEFLDFTNGYSESEELPTPEKVNCYVSPVKEEAAQPVCGGFCGNDDFATLNDGQLCVEAEGLESLEWLSHFVEDSFSDYSLIGKLPPTKESLSVPVQEQPCFATPVQTKARTKRGRTGVRVWPVLSPESSTSSSSSSTSSTTVNFGLPNKKQKRYSAAGVAVQPRKCSHCGVTKTPQWRAGPLGLKTLCNACGVRYKSGRLLPEYRPACSPTFSSDLHSNNHRKVLEMRRKKDSETDDTTGPVFPVQSF